MAHRALYYHIVFSTKQRRAMLKGDILERTCRYLAGIAHKLGGHVILAGGMPDHLHLATTIPATMPVADFVRTIKANSSAWLHQEFPHQSAFQWQVGYAAFTISPSVLPQVTRYISRQAQHHRRLTFEEELRALLEKHGVEYDKQYVLG